MNTLYWLIHTMALSGLRSFMGLEVINPEKRIRTGSAIIAANHTSYLDPPIVACSYDCEISFLARSTLFKGFGGWLYPRLNSLPIDRDHADIKSMKTILRALRNDNRLLMFPEGTRSADGQLQSAKPGIGMLVVKSGVPVQPVRIFGAHEAWPREGKFKLGKLTIVIGDPVEFEEADLKGKSREGYQRVADQLMAAIARLELPGQGKR